MKVKQRAKAKTLLVRSYNPVWSIIVIANGKSYNKKNATYW